MSKGEDDCNKCIHDIPKGYGIDACKRLKKGLVCKFTQKDKIEDCRNCETGANEYYCKLNRKRMLYIHSNGSLSHVPEDYIDKHDKSINTPFYCEKWSEKR